MNIVSNADLTSLSVTIMVEHQISVAVFTVGLLLGMVVTGSAGSGKYSSSPDPLTRANQTLQGMFEYYWMTDSRNKNISFFFACGQMGGWGATNWNKCSCNNPKSCSDCYRWWDAVAIESIANFGMLTGSKNYSDIPEEIYMYSPYNGLWPSVDGTYIDDFGWFGIAYLKVYDWLKDPKWLNISIALHDWGWKNGWDHTSKCGGYLWCTYHNLHFKDSITFLEFMHLAAKLAFTMPNETRFLETAEEIWDWIFSFDNGRGLFSHNNLVSTGAIPVNCCNASTTDPFRKCHNSNTPGTSYNQGLLLSSAAYLYRSTKNKTKYLDTGMKLLEAIFVNYTTQDGILIDEPRSFQTYNSYQCLGTTSDPGGDWYSFQGIMMIHLSYFAELLSETNDISLETLQRIKNLTVVTSDAAWNKSAVWPPFTQKDACNTNGLSSNSFFPKFHWWWNQNNTKQLMPPDPRPFFHKTNFRCRGNNTQIWEGRCASEDTCKEKCLNNSNCSKYLYNQQTLNCWLWSFSRTDHVCNEINTAYSVGFKRPVGNATCAGHCGSQEPQQLVHGVCYCDKDCSKYHDCCLDYVEMCQPNEPTTCKGMCNTVGSKPLYGGGYCWCFNGCNPWFTDNNSDGSCCVDYKEVCMNITMPTCLDARTQGSALNLFLAHQKLNMIKK